MERVEGGRVEGGRVEGKVAFITGAGHGQGRAEAVRLAEEGADIVATDACRPYPDVVRYPAASEADLAHTKLLVEKAGRRCITAVADVRDRAALQAAADLGVAELGGLDVVIGNAGVVSAHPSSLEIDEATYDLVVDTCMKGAWNTIQVTAPVLVARGGGSIVLTASVAGMRGHAHYAHYSAAKHAVVGMMRAFSTELAEYGVRVNAVAPTAVRSDGMGSREAMGDGRYLALQGMQLLPDPDAAPGAGFVPLPRVQVADVANAVLFLVSDEARFVTGVTLPVDAGNASKP